MVRIFPVTEKWPLWPLIQRRHFADRRGEVGVAVDELPVAVNAPVDVGNPEHRVAHRAAVDADMAALKAHRVGEVPLEATTVRSTSTASAPVKRLPTHCMVSVTGLCPFSMGPHAPNRVTSSETAQWLIMGPGSPLYMAFVVAFSCSSVLVSASSVMSQLPVLRVTWAMPAVPSWPGPVSTRFLIAVRTQGKARSSRSRSALNQGEAQCGQRSSSAS